MAAKRRKPGLCQEVTVDEGVTVDGPCTVLIEKIIGAGRARIRTIAHPAVKITRVKVRRNVSIEDVTKRGDER